jgi:hypothetical protein
MTKNPIIQRLKIFTSITEKDQEYSFIKKLKLKKEKQNNKTSNNNDNDNEKQKLRVLVDLDDIPINTNDNLKPLDEKEKEKIQNIQKHVKKEEEDFEKLLNKYENGSINRRKAPPKPFKNKIDIVDNNNNNITENVDDNNLNNINNINDKNNIEEKKDNFMTIYDEDNFDKLLSNYEK